MQHRGVSRCLLTACCSRRSVATLRNVLRAGNTYAVVWETKELIAINTALVRMLARSAGQQAVQLGLYATVQGARL
jgi:hypothetical protein